MTRPSALEILPPDECARRLGGISITSLVKLLREGGYSYVALTPGARPWGRGRQKWGLTPDQLATVIRGQTRRHPIPADSEADADAGPPRVAATLSLHGWDGIDRLKMSRRHRAAK